MNTFLDLVIGICKFKKLGGSFIGLTKWIKKKKITINPQNHNNDKGFRRAVTAAFNHESFENTPKISLIEAFIR